MWCLTENTSGADCERRSCGGSCDEFSGLLDDRTQYRVHDLPKFDLANGPDIMGSLVTTEGANFGLGLFVKRDGVWASVAYQDDSKGMVTVVYTPASGETDFSWTVYLLGGSGVYSLRVRALL